jgi:aconitate hydratase
MFRTYDGSQPIPDYSDIVTLDLSTVKPTLAGPKLPHDRVGMMQMKSDWNKCLTAKVSSKGFGLKNSQIKNSGKFEFQGKTYTLKNGDIIIAAITSCTNTSNPMVMLAAGMVAKKAVEAGLTVLPYIKTSLSPGSKVVISYLKASGYLPYLQQLGFCVSGFGCQTCIGNSGDIH